MTMSLIPKAKDLFHKLYRKGQPGEGYWAYALSELTDEAVQTGFVQQC